MNGKLRQHTLCITVVSASDATESLLSSRVPDLQSHAKNNKITHGEITEQNHKQQEKQPLHP